MTNANEKIEFAKADITKQDVDAIVNAANGKLRHGGGVAKAIRLAAGDEPFQRHCFEEIEAHGEIEVGEAVITEPFELPCRKVIHAVGPIYGEHDGAEAELLASAYRYAILLAAENDLHSLAFPAISCGIFGYPLDEAAATAVKAIMEALEEVEGLGATVPTVRFCFIGDEDMEAFESALHSLEGR